jgi:phage gpG-like protein
MQKTMTQQEYIAEIQKQINELADFQRRRWGVIVGRMAKDHYRDNFRKSGFVNNGLKKWEPAKRITSGRKGAASKYKTLLSSRNHLFNSIQYVPGDRRVVISNPVPYAAAHQNGEKIEIPITDKMRRFAWAKYYEASGIPKKDTGNPTWASYRKEHGLEKPKKTVVNEKEASLWKGLALTPKKKISVKLPARPFIGESAELTQKINDKTEAEIRKILTL